MPRTLFRIWVVITVVVFVPALLLAWLAPAGPGALFANAIFPSILSAAAYVGLRVVAWVFAEE
jgi:hypothetical protein